MENKTPFTRSWPFTILLILLLTFICGIISGIFGIGFSGAAIGALIGAVIVFTRRKPAAEKTSELK
jgi:membrane associated rhomboid family serine protease